MLEIDIPGRGIIQLEYVVFDFNGTLALDGKLIPGVKERLESISKFLQIVVLTADTFGLCRQSLEGIDCRIEIIKADIGAPAKLQFIKQLGAEKVVAIGNGQNDRMMLGGAALGILVVGPEGASVKSLASADIAVTDIISALELLLEPKRLVATLRE